MVRRHLPDASKGPRCRPVVVIMALLLALALPVRAMKNCEGFDCGRHCNVENFSDYRPQQCGDCCELTGSTDNGGDNAEVNGRMAAMETAIQELRVMVGVILALMVLLLLAVVAMFLRHTSTHAFKAALPVFFSRKKDEGRASIEKRPPPPSTVPAENRNSTVVRIADYQNNHSPLSKRMRPNGQAGHEDTTAAGPHFLPPGELPRTRQPSESTCPDDSTDMPPNAHHHAYDNLALSTSTLHDTTTSSTSTLGAAVSTNTLDTTLPSVNPTAPVMEQV